MDRVVKVRRSFLNLIRGFLNIFAEECSGCMRKEQFGCYECDNMRARELIHEIDNLRDAEEERFFINNPREELFEKIKIAIRQGGGVCRSHDIHIPGICRQRKFRALKDLVKRGEIARMSRDGQIVFAVLDDCKHNIQHKRNNKKGKK